MSDATINEYWFLPKTPHHFCTIVKMDCSWGPVSLYTVCTWPRLSCIANKQCYLPHRVSAKQHIFTALSPHRDQSVTSLSLCCCPASQNTTWLSLQLSKKVWEKVYVQKSLCCKGMFRSLIMTYFRRAMITRTASFQELPAGSGTSCQITAHI